MMKPLFATTFLTLNALALLSSSLLPHQANAQVQRPNSVKFVCEQGFDPETNRRIPTTYAWTPRGKIAVIRWQYKWFNNPDITPEFRCGKVSDKFQKAYDEKSLNYITNGQENGQPVICTAFKAGGNCVTTLLTLRPSDDPIEIATELNQSLRGRGGSGPIRHSGGEPRVYYQIDIEEFLQTAPIEKQ